MYNKTIIALALLLSINCIACASDNNLRSSFLENKSNICGINLRTFNAEDLNGNQIIDENENSGNFINAIARLDELKELNINALHVLPITPVGKLKALGTAGSLYAAENFWSINPQLVDKTSELSDFEQAKLFIDECHKRGIRVIIDLPSCGAYDLYLTHPELFVKDEKRCSVVPTDWTDVRLLNTGHDNHLNQDVLDIHKKFIDMLIEIGADGIRADVATIKPFNFWKNIITYARQKDPEFMFLAEASDSWREPPSSFAVFTPYDKLLEAGFDGYYGSFFNLKEWSANDLYEHVKFNQKLLSSFNEQKSVIMSFTTHDELSPILLHGENYSKMISWLEATLPFNPYIIDGFYTGDDYLYPWENTNALKTETDDDTYFVHRGKLDIFNFSRKPGGNNQDILNNFKAALDFRKENLDLITKGSFSPLKTANAQIFAFQRSLNNTDILVLGNLDFKNSQENISIKIVNINKKTKIDLITGNDDYKLINNKIITSLQPGEVKVFKLQKIKK